MVVIDRFTVLSTDKLWDTDYCHWSCDQVEEESQYDKEH